MAILVGDANIFIDMDVGDLIRPMFRLEDVFVTPDVLYREELKERHAELSVLGLRIERLNGDEIAEVDRLSILYPEPSFNDLLALGLAKERQWPLLSGDRSLRKVAVTENVEVHGTIWILERLVECKVLSMERAQNALALMRNGGRRLPWAKAEEMLAQLGFGENTRA